jgi:hypothetical protein
LRNTRVLFKSQWVRFIEVLLRDNIKLRKEREEYEYRYKVILLERDAIMDRLRELESK